MLLTKLTDISTGEQGDAFVVCAECYITQDQNLAMRVDKSTIYICIVKDKVSGRCSECGETDEETGRDDF